MCTYNVHVCGGNDLQPCIPCTWSSTAVHLHIFPSARSLASFAQLPVYSAPTTYNVQNKKELYTNWPFRNSTSSLKLQKIISRGPFWWLFFTNVALWYHSSTISDGLLVLHCDEGVVWCVDSILEYLRLSVQLEGHLVVGCQLLSGLCDLIKMELQSQQHRTQALSGNYIIRK